MGKVTADEMVEAVLRPIHQVLLNEGLTPKFLARKLMQELSYLETVTVGRRRTRAVTPSAMRIRQEARKDAHKLRGDYPAEKHEITGKGEGPIRIIYTNDWRQNGNGDTSPIPSSWTDSGEE